MTPERAKKILTDPDQVNRIKNTASGYDEIIVQGSPKYTDVIEKATDGLPNIKKIEKQMMNKIEKKRKQDPDFAKKLAKAIASA